jgi:hypothetical protein
MHNVLKQKEKNKKEKVGEEVIRRKNDEGKIMLFVSSSYFSFSGKHLPTLKMKTMNGLFLVIFEHLYLCHTFNSYADHSGLAV